MNASKKLAFLSAFLFILIIPILFNFNFLNISSSNFSQIINPSGASDINLDETSLSVQYGTNIQEDRPYTFSGAFYDITNDARTWSTPAVLETTFVLDPDVHANDTITDLNNVETQSPSNSSIIMTQGSQYQNGTLNQLDNDPAIFNSTDDNAVEAVNFTTSYGSEVSAGNLTSIDGDYSTYQSESQINIPSNSSFILNNGTLYQNGSLATIDGDYSIFNSTESGHFPATYSFTDNVDGNDPSDWIPEEDPSTDVFVQGSLSNHKKILHFDDNNAGAGNDLAIYQIEDEIENGTVEFWFYLTRNDYESGLGLYDGVNYIAYVYFGRATKFGYYVTGYNDLVVVSINTWHHFRIDFECGAGGYMGLSPDTFCMYLDSVKYGDYSSISLGALDKIRFVTGYSSTDDFYIDAVGYSWDTNYDIGDNLNMTPPVLNFTTTFQLTMEDRNLAIFHSLKTDTSQIINISIYNFDTSTFDLVNSSISLAFTLDHFLFNSSYYNATNYMIINIVGNNTTTEFHCYLEVLHARNSPILNVESTINCNLLNNIIYSYKTNITQNIELYLYDFSSSSYDLLYNYSYLTFNLNYTSISSVYHNGTALRVRFRAINFDYNNFTFYLEVLKAINITRLDLTMHVNLDYIAYLLQLNCSAWYYTPIYTIMNFSIYDFENSEWILMNSSGNDVGFYESKYVDNTASLNDLIDTTNDNQVLVRFNALSNTNEFDLNLDCLNITVYRKLVLSFEKTFTLLGTWKYRFHIPEDGYSSSWYYFDVVQHADNFMAISESPYITKWILLGNETEISTSRIFHDDLTGTYSWNVYDASGDLMSDYIIDEWISGESTEVDSQYPTWNFNDWSVGHTDDNGLYKARTLLEFNDYTNPYALNEQYSNTILRVYSELVDDYHVVDVWRVQDFTPSSVTWNTQPATITKLYDDFDFGSVDHIYVYMDVGDRDVNNHIAFYETTYQSVYYEVVIRSDNKPYDWEKPTLLHYLYRDKIENSYLVAQTNMTETMKIRSQQFYEINTDPNDYILLKCRTSLEDVNINLMYEGNVIKTLTLLNDNVNYDNQTLEISIDDEITFDQIEFEGIYNEYDYFYLYDLDIYTYDFSTREQTNTFYVAPEESYSFLSNTGVHQLKIYDNNILRVDKFITITHDIEDNLEVYTPIYSTDCRLTITDQENNLLELSLFQVYITRILSDTTSRISLLDVNFRADLGTTVKFEFYDRFGDFIKNETKEVESFIFIELTIYSLKIKNEAKNQSDITITKTGSSTEIEDVFSPGELYEYKLIAGNYTIEWLNHENDEITDYNITLSSDYILTLPTSYFNVYFSLFNFDGLGLSNDLIRFYINDERKDLGFNTLTQNTNNLTVLDYFNATLFNQSLNLRQYSEYNIYVEIWNLIIENQYRNQSIRIEIERSGIIVEQVIQPQFSINYRFLPGVVYEIRAYDLNDTLLDNKTIELNTNNKIVSFGFYSTEIPETPEIVVPEFIDYVFVVIILLAIAGVLFIAFLISYRKYQDRKRKMDKVLQDKNMMRY